jgi:hypothetical protein
VVALALAATACSGAAGGGSVGDEATAPATGSSATTRTAAAPTSTDPPAIEPAAGAMTEPPRPGPDHLPLPIDAASLARALEEAETAVRDPSLAAEDLGAWGRRQQSLYRHLSFHPDWVEDALALGDPALRRAAELNWEARVHLEALVASEGPHTELPAWRIVDPRPADELLGYYKQGESEWGIPWPYLAAINLIETRMGRIEGVSSAGAVGPMQFLPTTWAECCDGDPTDPADAIPGAARYLDIRGGPDDMAKAVWGYNNSDHYVAAVTAYATVMAEDERAYHGYHGWEIYFRSTEGLIRIPQGYQESEPVPATEWLARHPDTLVTG